MRDILFKAKRIDNGEWVEGCLVFDEFCSSSYPQIGYMHTTKPSFYEVRPDTICQYTGFTDKNGNKIWENDVVEILTEDGYFTIEWSDTEARWQMDNELDNFIVDFDNYWSHEVEVIGNIFDNHELIGGGSDD